MNALVLLPLYPLLALIFSSFRSAKRRRAKHRRAGGGGPSGVTSLRRARVHTTTFSARGSLDRVGSAASGAGRPPSMKLNASHLRESLRSPPRLQERGGADRPEGGVGSAERGAFRPPAGGLEPEVTLAPPPLARTPLASRAPFSPRTPRAGGGTPRTPRGAQGAPRAASAASVNEYAPHPGSRERESSLLTTYWSESKKSSRWF